MFYLCLSTHTGPTQAPNAPSSAGARLIPQTGAERSEQHCCAHLIDNRYPEFQNHHIQGARQGSPSSTAKGKSSALCPPYHCTPKTEKGNHTNHSFSPFHTHNKLPIPKHHLPSHSSSVPSPREAPLSCPRTRQHLKAPHTLSPFLEGHFWAAGLQTRPS